MSPKPIFREYIIGSKEVPPIEGFPVEIINRRIPEFHFILAFAAEDYVEDGSGKKVGKGNFSANWNVTKFSAKKIRELKEDYEHVKVVISLGGRGTNFPFNPQDKEIWIDNAKKSLNQIITVLYKFHHETVIDGIDINYEHIESSEDEFAYCIGKVIDYLKSNISGVVVSIAPSFPVLSHYQQLFKANPHRIQWVNYQYYDQKVPSTHEFVNLHKTLIDTFGVEKLLAGFSTDPNDKGNISAEVFVEGVLQLLASGSLAGIFVSDAQSSLLSEPPLYLEKKSQEILTGTN
ncbi:chitinase 2-like [Vigna unguiculata]|uniref:Glycoside hydrolase superfamily n=1 Tax=Vigna unguiculata TaxID=3917 RepID=A0A4D6NH36_VIGUN|nr:chitinase 2-like [Vigna unguiculata]XP_027904647.1 chitinase 2-like [Vigna unguiculata]QCE13163.1 Glycoside hydrolase superfamily [Vigna unguiculata]